MSKVLNFLIIILIFAIVVALFFLANPQAIEFNLFGNTRSISLGYLVAGFSIFGLLLGLFYSFSLGIGDRKSTAQYKQRITELEKQIDGMKMSLETLSNTLLKTNPPTSEGTISDSNIVEDVLKELKSNQ